MRVTVITVDSATRTRACKRIYTHLSYGLVNSPEGGLFAVVVDPPVPVQDIHAVLFGRRAVAAVDAVVWPIVPLARELQQAL